MGMLAARLTTQLPRRCRKRFTGEKYSSETPEPFTFIPEGRRTITLADGSVTSPFLEMFGRPPRDTGLELERNSRITSAQRLHLLNSSHVQKKIENSPVLQQIFQSAPSKTPKRPGRGGKAADSGDSGQADEAVTTLYLTILSRRPTPDEVRIFRDTIANATNRRDAIVDLTWSLLNTTEFLCRH
jgi:hypothetical protein